MQFSYLKHIFHVFICLYLADLSLAQAPDFVSKYLTEPQHNTVKALFSRDPDAGIRATQGFVDRLPLSIKNEFESEFSRWKEENGEDNPRILSIQTHQVQHNVQRSRARSRKVARRVIKPAIQTAATRSSLSPSAPPVPPSLSPLRPSPRPSPPPPPPPSSVPPPPPAPAPAPTAVSPPRPFISIAAKPAADAPRKADRLDFLTSYERKSIGDKLLRCQRLQALEELKAYIDLLPAAMKHEVLQSFQDELPDFSFLTTEQWLKIQHAASTNQEDEAKQLLQKFVDQLDPQSKQRALGELNKIVQQFPQSDICTLEPKQRLNVISRLERGEKTSAKRLMAAYKQLNGIKNGREKARRSRQRIRRN